LSSSYPCVCGVGSSGGASPAVCADGEVCTAGTGSCETNPSSSGIPLQWAHDSSFCMSVVDNEFQNGQKMQLWECAGGSGQHFDFNNNGENTLLKLSAAPEYCVVIDGNADVNGADIQLWHCDSLVEEQQWTPQHCGMQCPYGNVANPSELTTLRNAAFPDKCIVVDGNVAKNGARIQLWSCDGDADYKMWNP